MAVGKNIKLGKEKTGPGKFRKKIKILKMEVGKNIKL